MPDFHKPPDRWFSDRLARDMRDMAGQQSQSTEYIVDPRTQLCVAIVGNLEKAPIPRSEAEPNGGFELTGLEGWGAAVKTASGWVSLNAGVGSAVTSLPTKPMDGQEVDYLADAVAGVIWRLKYRAASASPHKWEFVGGSDLYSLETEHDGSGPQSPAAAFATSIMEFTPGLTLPLAGDYDIYTQAVGMPQSEAGADIRIYPVAYPSATSLSVLPEVGFTVARGGTNAVYASVAAWNRCAGVAAGTVAALGFAGSNTAASLKWYGKTMRARPVRVG